METVICIVCRRTVAGWYDLDQGPVCLDCHEHEALHDAIKQHLEIHDAEREALQGQHQHSEEDPYA